MSRKQTREAPAPPQQAQFEEEETVSASGEQEEMEEVEEDQEGYTSSTPTSTLTWISWFCSLPGHEYFCEVAEEFIEDDFNLTGLNAMVPFFKEALEMVLDVEPDEDSSKIPDVSIVEASAEVLYGLVHQRYIITRSGLQAMADKYEAGMFGSCQRVYCSGTNVVPSGRYDVPGLDTVKLFCPNCCDIYNPPSSRFQGIDGAYFGTTFAHLFFHTYRDLSPAPFVKSAANTLSPVRSPRPSGSANGVEVPPFVNPNPHGGQKRPAARVYTPRIYGFRVSERAKSGPRMLWLRTRPERAEELDLVDWRGRWMDDDEDEEDYEDPEEDGQMEDFDPEGAPDEDDDEEEEEEEDAPPTKGGAQGRRLGASVPAPSSPASTGPPVTPRDEPFSPSIQAVLAQHDSVHVSPKVRAVRRTADVERVRA